LTYQFVAGLKPGIRLKVAGNEGSFDQLLLKARLEEAKLRDLRVPQGHTRSLRLFRKAIDARDTW